MKASIQWRPLNESVALEIARLGAVGELNRERGGTACARSFAQ